jgi:hypothetical protein
VAPAEAGAVVEPLRADVAVLDLEQRLRAAVRSAPRRERMQDRAPVTAAPGFGAGRHRGDAEPVADDHAAPDREIHVHELIGEEAEASDAGEILDATARRAYQARLTELGAALDEATRHHDLGRAERLRAEVDALTDQLTAAVGLGGRVRRAGSTVERARINVQRRLRDAIGKIAAEDPTLGRYLEASIRTGVFCSFDGTMFRALGTPS